LGLIDEYEAEDCEIKDSKGKVKNNE